MKYLHTMVRVADVDRSLDFYCNMLGFREVRRMESPQGRFTLIYLAAPGDNDDDAQLELTHNWGREERYQIGTGFGHLAIGVPDVYGTCKTLEEEGVRIARKPGPMAHGGSVIAFIDDPDGYKIELIERK